MSVSPETETTDTHQRSSLHRSFAVLRALGAAPQGLRVTYLAQHLGLTPATTHRLLQALVQEGVVEQEPQHKRYRLSLELFCLGAQAGAVNDLRTLARPALLRLNARLGDTVLLLVRAGFDAVCLDRVEGDYPIRTFTGDIGGRVALGVGQAGLVILAHLPDAEREEVLNFNLPRLRQYGVFDEVSLRTAIARARSHGSYGQPSGVIEGMAGLAVPVFDRAGTVVAALSIGTHTSRLSEERRPLGQAMLAKEAAQLSQSINPFDPTLRHPMQALQSRHTTLHAPLR